MKRKCTDTLVEFALAPSYDDLPRDVQHATKRVLLDTIGCSIAGLDTQIGRSLTKLKQRQGGVAESILFASGVRLPAPSIAFVHAQAANSMDADETLLHRSHFACSIALPALAFAEKLGSSGKDLLAASAVGFDIASRVNLALPLYDVSGANEVKMVRIHGYSAAVFGTTAAVGRLLGLSRKQMSHAYAIAYANAPLQRVRSGSRKPMTKYTAYGQIALAGAEAALLAADGFTGDDAILDPHLEFWRGLGADSCDYDFMLRDLGKRWFIAETSFKPYPVGRQANIPVDLFGKIVSEQRLRMEEIEEVVVRVPPSRLVQDLAQALNPESSVDAPFSVGYGMTMIATGLPPGPKWHRTENFTNPVYLAFMRKLRGEVVPEWHATMVEQIKSEGTYRRIPTEVQVTARGQTFTAFAEYPRGDPWTTESVLSDQQIFDKFTEFTSDRLQAPNALRAITAVFGLDAAPDITDLISALA